MMNFLIDHLGWVLVVGLLMAAWGLTSSLRLLWRLYRRRRDGERGKGWLGAAAGAVVGLAVAGGVLLFFGQGLLVMGPALAKQAWMRGDTAPELPFVQVTSGDQTSLEKYRGQVVLLNFWATWCVPCRAEMPDLDRLQESHGEKGLVVLQISDEDLPTIAAFLDETPMSTVHGQSEAERWPRGGLPTSFVIDRQGVVRRVITGPRSFEQFEEIVQKYL